MTNRYPRQIQSIIKSLRTLPGVGQKSAERYAFHMLQWPVENLVSFSQSVNQLSVHRSFCQVCGCLLEMDVCEFCSLERIEKKSLCVVAQLKDVYSLDQHSLFKGCFHVLGGILSPINGKDASKLNWTTLISRIDEHHFDEIVLAIEGTLDGDATSFWLKNLIDSKCNYKPKISRLAFGLSIGSSLENTDEMTLSRAFSGRQLF